MSADEWLPKEEVAEMLGITPRSVAELFRNGKLHTRRKFDRSYVYLRSEVEAHKVAPKKRTRRYFRKRYPAEAFCRRCEILLAEMPASPDPRLCDACWVLTHPKPKAIARPMAIVNPAYLER